MSRSVFANTIGAFVLEGIPSHTHARSNGLMDNLMAAGGEVVKDAAVEYVEDEYGEAAGTVAGQAIDAGYDRAGIPSSESDVIVIQPQQSTPQDYNPMAAAQAIAASRAPLASSGMFFRPGINAQTVATAQGVLDAQRRVQQAQAFDAARRAAELLNQQGQSQATGQTSQVTEDPKKEEKKKPFFKTGAGIATILVGAAAIAGGIVYFATQE